MKSLVKIYLLLLLPFIAKAQSISELDSLHYALKMAENDSVRMHVLSRFYTYYAESNRDSALFFTEQGLAISKKIKQPLWTAFILLNKSYLFQRQGNLSLSIKLINESIALSKNERNEKSVYFPKGLKAGWDNPNEWRLFILGGGFQNLGNTYRRAGNAEKAISSYKEAIRTTKDNKEKVSFISANSGLGSTYLELNKIDSAMFYARNALMFSNSYGHWKYKGNPLRVIGDIFFRQKQLDSAKYYYRQSLIVSREQGNVASEIATAIAFAKLYESIVQADSMLYYSNVGFRMASGLKEEEQKSTSAELMSNAFKSKGYLDSALTYLTISKKIADSLNKVKTEKLMEFQYIGFEEQMQLEKRAQESVAYKNKIQIISLLSGLGLLSILAFVFYRNNRQKQKANKVLETTLTNLKSTQAQLIQSEKMASLGELTAGIAHEIQNPLNFVNNFSEVSSELIDEMKEELAVGSIQFAVEIADDIKGNLEKINHHGKRADAIVKGMLQHSRTSTGQKEPTDINALCEEYLRLSYHGMKARDNSFEASFRFEPDHTLPKINVVPQDIGRLLQNLINNAFQAVHLVATQCIASLPNAYTPTVTLYSKNLGDRIEISISDNGPGIPDAIKDKIFQPFFTTKPTGQGTGLGLSLAYDIVKAHGGELKVENKNGDGSEFIIILPLITL